MTLGDLSVDGLFYPGDFIHQRVVVLFHQLYGKSILGVNNPYEQEPILLNLVKRYIHDLLVTQGGVGNGDTPRRIGI